MPLPAFGPMAVTLTSPNATPVDTVVVVVPTGAVVVVEVTVVAKTGNLNGAGYTLTGTFKNASGTAAQVGATVAAVVNEDAALSAAAVAFTVSGANVRVRTIGIAASVEWTIAAYITQV